MIYDFYDFMMIYHKRVAHITYLLTLNLSAQTVAAQKGGHGLSTFLLLLQNNFFRLNFSYRTLFSDLFFAVELFFQIIFLLQIIVFRLCFCYKSPFQIIFLLQNTLLGLYFCYRRLFSNYILATEHFVKIIFLLQKTFFSNYIFATDHFLTIIFLLQNTFLRLYFSSEHFFRLYFCFRLPLSFLLLGLF